MNSTKTLFVKELVEHRWLLCSLLFTTAFYIWIGYFNIEKLRYLSLLTIAWAYVYYMVPSLGVVLGHQIIAREQLGRTARFLDGLPVSGHRIFIVKSLFGLCSLIALVALMLATVCLLAASSEDLNVRSISVLAMRCFAMVAVVWGVVVCFSYFGALRLPLFAFVLLIGLFVHRFTEIELLGTGPFEIMEHGSFAYDGYLIPWRPFFICLAIGLVGVAAGYWLARFREGGLAQSLARPMAEREYYMLVACILIAVAAFVRLDAPSRGVDYAFDGIDTLISDDSKIQIRFKEADGEELARFLFDDLERLTRELRTEHKSLDGIPTIRVFLDDRQVDASADYVAAREVIRVSHKVKDNYLRAFFHSTVLHNIFARTSYDRALFKRNHWFLDGYSVWFALKQQRPGGETYRRLHAELMARSILAMRQITADTSVTQHWEEIVESVGTYSAQALAYSLIYSLVENFGDRPVLNLADALLLEQVPRNWNISWVDRFRSFEQQFYDLSGIAWPRLIQAWTRDLEKSAVEPAIHALLKPYTDVRLWLETQPDGDVEFGFKDENDEFVVPSVLKQCYLRHSETRSWRRHQVESSLGSIDVSCDTMVPAQRTLKHSYDHDAKVFVALDFDVEGFFGSIRLAAQRVVIK